MTHVFDFGLELIFLSLAYFGLIVIWRSKKSVREKNILIAAVLLTTLLFSIFATRNVARDSESRFGVERLIDAGFKSAVVKIVELQRSTFPSQVQIDDVPQHLQSSNGSFKTDIYRVSLNENFTKVSSNIFLGQLEKIQFMSSGDFVASALILLTMIVIVLVLNFKFASARLMVAALILISTLSIFLSLRYSEGWDEFFINLRHSYMLLHHGVFSVNANSMLEATVDFIPLVGTAFLGLIGIDLIDGFIVFSLLGSVAVIVFSFLITLKITKNQSWALAASLLAGLYPNVIYVSASGFSAVFFTGWIMAASYFLLFTERRLLGLIILSTLTLVRTEGILFAVLLMTYLYVIKPLPNTIRNKEWKLFFKEAVLDGAIVAVPFILSLLVRHWFYGHAIPNPISFKNTNFDNAFFASGFNRFAQMVSTHDLHLAVVLIALLFVANVVAWRGDKKLQTWSQDVKKLLALDAVIFLFILPYYVGGGDWFPNRWNRYGLPLNIALLLTLVIMLYGAFSCAKFSKSVGRVSLFVFCLSLIISYKSSIKLRLDNFVPSNFSEVVKNRWGRVNDLAVVGQFLKETLPQDAVVSSPEEATIMYFSQREMLGLLGVSNPEMVNMPLQPLSPGDILHRKRGYESVYKNRPDVIALWDPTVVGDFNGDNAKEKIRQALSGEFSEGKTNVIYYRVGSFAALEKMGYQHFTISYPDRIFSLFIGERIRDKFIESLLSKGFKYSGSDFVKYSVSSDITKKYAPASKELMKDL